MSREALTHASLAPCRPRYEGANVRTWIGFKHILYLVEESMLEFLRGQDLGPHRLFSEHGVGVQIIDSSVQLPTPVYIDDQIVGEVEERTPGRYRVVLRALRGEQTPVVALARVRLALVEQRGAAVSAPVPGRLRRVVVPSISLLASGGDLTMPPGADARSALVAEHARATLWTWRARYFLCHYSDCVQHSAYVRALEEVVERFLAERGLSVRTVMETYGWIPVVARTRLRLFADVHMDEDVHTRFTVGEILKDTAYEGRMECFVERQRRLVHVATGDILHGYAESGGVRAGSLVLFDERTKAALRGRAP
jgi:acyl-CoA thioesterase FadM